MIKIKKEKVLIRPKDLKPSSSKFKILGTLNPGAVRLPDGKIMLYIRVLERLKKYKDSKYYYSPRLVGKKKYKLVLDKFPIKKIVDSSEIDFSFEDGTKRLTFISHFRRVLLDSNGFKVLWIDKRPSFYGLENDGELGVEDPRITYVDGKYVMTYVTLSREENVSTSLAISEDCINWDRKGIIFGEQDKDVVVFPEKIAGKYVAYDRPEGNFQFTPPHIWIAYSKDLLEWGKLKSVNFSKRGDEDFGRNGAGPPPIKTSLGWLLLYHSVSEKKILKHVCKKSNFDKIKSFLHISYEEECEDEFETETTYSVRAALFNLKNPRKLIAKSSQAIIFPNKDYYRGSFEDDKFIVFPTGLVLDKNEKNILIYSGAGDTFITAKKVALKDILNSLKKVKKFI